MSRKLAHRGQARRRWLGQRNDLYRDLTRCEPVTQEVAHWLCHEGISAARLRVVYRVAQPLSTPARSPLSGPRAWGQPRSRSVSRSGGPLSIACFWGGAAGGVSTRVRSRRLATGAGRRVLTRSHDADVVSFRGQLQSLPKERLPPSPAQAAANMRHDSRQTGMTRARAADA
jgi:hypothetical protein